VVLVHFWATWCPPCIEELPQWVALAKKYTGRPLQMVAVSLDSDWEAPHRLLPESEVTSPLISLLDPERKSPEDYGSYQFPETYLIDRSHRIVHKWVGPQDWSNPATLEPIERSLNN
jgi:thiol-disulfide isomerase/thioredoxin